MFTWFAREFHFTPDQVRSMRHADFVLFLESVEGREVSAAELEADINRRRAAKGLPPMKKGRP